jgi:hypothetical protein
MRQELWAELDLLAMHVCEIASDRERAVIGNGAAFAKGRDLAAWLELTPCVDARRRLEDELCSRPHRCRTRRRMCPRSPTFQPDQSIQLPDIAALWRDQYHDRMGPYSKGEFTKRRNA